MLLVGLVTALDQLNPSQLEWLSQDSSTGQYEQGIQHWSKGLAVLSDN